MSWNSITLISCTAVVLVVCAALSKDIGPVDLSLAGFIVLLLWGAQMFGNLFRDNDEPL
jgi:hypothetical protein